MAFQGFKSCSGRITGSHADVLVTLSKRIPGWSYKKEKDSRDKDRDRDSNRERENKEGVRKSESSKWNNISNQPASDSQISLRRYACNLKLALDLLPFLLFLRRLFRTPYFLFFISFFLLFNYTLRLSFLPIHYVFLILLHGV